MCVAISSFEIAPEPSVSMSPNISAAFIEREMAFSPVASSPVVVGNDGVKKALKKENGSAKDKGVPGSAACTSGCALVAVTGSSSTVEATAISSSAASANSRRAETASTTSAVYDLIPLPIRKAAAIPAIDF